MSLLVVYPLKGSNQVCWEDNKRMSLTKPIDFLDLGICKYCFPWSKPPYYEVPEKTYWGCNFGGSERKFYAEEPCRITDYYVCPMRRKR